VSSTETFSGRSVFAWYQDNQMPQSIQASAYCASNEVFLTYGMNHSSNSELEFISTGPTGAAVSVTPSRLMDITPWVIDQCSSSEVWCDNALSYYVTVDSLCCPRL
jgi:hypothetical protein